MNTKPLKAIGLIDEDALEIATLVKRRLKNRDNGTAGLTLWSKDGLVYATHADGQASQTVQAFALIGVYTHRATVPDIADDIIEWRAAA